MKLVDFYWDHPALQPYRKTIPHKQYLFKQGDPATTMYIILQGLVELQTVFEGKATPIGVVEAGQFLGEKAVLRDKPHERVFSAIAKTELKIVEIKWEDFAKIYLEDTAVITDMLKHMFKIAAERLDKSNQLIRILRSSNNIERVVRYLLYFAHHYGVAGKNGTEFTLKLGTLHYYIDMDQSQIADCLQELVVNNLLTRISEDAYCIPDEKAILEFIGKLTTFMTVGFYDGLESIP
jgi:CRP-like cAMP-binding protein